MNAYLIAGIACWLLVVMSVGFMAGMVAERLETNLRMRRELKKFLAGAEAIQGYLYAQNAAIKARAQVASVDARRPN